MTAVQKEAASESLQLCNAYLARVTRSIETLKLELESTKKVSKYTSEIRKKISRIEQKIEDLELRRTEAEKMREFPPGSWVRNGTTRPGKVINLVIAGLVPEVHVQWSGSNITVPERPFQLKLLQLEDIEYIWNGDRFPKLVRKIDQHECDEVEILDEKLLQAAYDKVQLHPEDTENINDYERRITYLKKRIQYLNEPQRSRISIAAIRRNGGTQQRVKLNHETVAEYAEAMKDGDKFPPVKLTYDGTDYWLTDGFHTTEAAWSIGQKFIEAEVIRGTQRDAILASVAVNAQHGLRRTNADKRRAVTTLLEDKEWGKWSNREIARRCKVSESLVRNIKSEREGCVQYAVSKCTNPSDLTAFKRSDNPINDNEITSATLASDNRRSYIDKYGNVSQMNTANIGSDNKQELSLDNPKNINKDSNCPNKEPALEIKDFGAYNSTDKLLTDSFEIGQLVIIDPPSDRPDKRLVGHHSSRAVITKVNSYSVNLRVWGNIFDAVAVQDIKAIDKADDFMLCNSVNQKVAAFLMQEFDSPEQLIQFVLKEKNFYEPDLELGDRDFEPLKNIEVEPISRKAEQLIK